MKTRLHLIAVPLAALAFLFTLTTQAEELDFGDHSSSAITAKAWDALSKGNSKNAIAYASKCIELHGKEAIKMQAKLKDFADEDSANDHWALNDVGTCYFIKGQAQANSGKKKEAIATYKHLAKTLEFSQCWDPQGWFWHPAEAATEAASELAD